MGWTDYLGDKWYDKVGNVLAPGLYSEGKSIGSGDISKNDITTVLDPGDFSGRQTAKDQLEAGKEAQRYLQQLSDTAWARQMQGLQQALGSMNSYNGILSQIYGVPTNYYNPAQAGGVLGQQPGAAQPAPPVTLSGPPAPVPPSTGPAAEPRKGYGHF